MRALPAACVALLAALSSASAQTSRPAAEPLRVGFLMLDGVYNSELMAPYDVFQHTVFHVQPGMEVFTVGRTMETVRTFEGLRIEPDYDLESAPLIDVLVVPSAEHNMDSDLEDEALIAWLARRGARAGHVLSVCDGAFLLAEAGLLQDRQCTTFPGDIAAFRSRYPELSVIEDVSFIADGPLITGAGGAASYDPAMYLVQKLYGVRTAEGIGKGLVIDWKLDAVAHVAGGKVAALRPPTSFLPGDRIPEDVTVEDAAGAKHTLGELVGSAGVRGVVLLFLGGGSAVPRPERGDMWCEDSFNDLSIMRRLVRDYTPRGITFVPVLCPPVYHERDFGYDAGSFLTSSDADSEFQDNRRRFVEATTVLHDNGLLPFSKIWFDSRFRLLANPKHGVAAGPSPEWQGKCKWYRDPQTYGTPTLWVLEPDLTVFGEPFSRNNYEAEGGTLSYSARDVAARLDRLLRKEGN